MKDENIDEKYQECHRPENQKFVEGFPFNPVLRWGFEVTAKECRDPQEIKDWWDQPFIRTSPGWSSDVKYDVACLDGGAWDRPTDWGSYESLEEAVFVAKSGGGLELGIKMVEMNKLCDESGIGGLAKLSFFSEKTIAELVQLAFDEPASFELLVFNTSMSR